MYVHINIRIFDHDVWEATSHLNMHSNGTKRREKTTVCMAPNFLSHEVWVTTNHNNALQ